MAAWAGWHYVLLALACYGLDLTLKACRFYFYLQGKLPLSTLVPVVWIHSFWNNMLPYRSGELSYLYLLRQSGLVRDGDNLTSLLAARFFDALALLLMVATATILLFPAQSGALWAAQLTGTLAVMGAVLLGLTALIIWNQSAVAVLVRFQARMSAKPKKLLGKLAEAIGALDRLRGWSSLGAFTLLSLGVWLSDIAYVWAVLRAADISLSPLHALFITAFPVLAALIPVPTPAAVGAFEGTVAGGLLLLGLSKTQALTGSVFLHVHLLASTSLLLVLALLWRRYGRKIKA